MSIEKICNTAERSLFYKNYPFGHIWLPRIVYQYETIKNLLYFVLHSSTPLFMLYTQLWDLLFIWMLKLSVHSSLLIKGWYIII